MSIGGRSVEGYGVCSMGGKKRALADLNLVPWSKLGAVVLDKSGHLIYF